MNLWHIIKSFNCRFIFSVSHHWLWCRNHAAISVPAKQLWQIWSLESRKKYTVINIIYINKTEYISYGVYHISSRQTPVPIQIYTKLHVKVSRGTLRILWYNSLDGNNPYVMSAVESYLVWLAHLIRGSKESILWGLFQCYFQCDKTLRHPCLWTIH